MQSQGTLCQPVGKCAHTRDSQPEGRAAGRGQLWTGPAVDAVHHKNTGTHRASENAAWYYPTPSPVAAQITDRVAFWRGVKVEK
ncbi:MAG: DUF427 domain-containing protein [Caldilineaceae bacterium]|nr:DUF427 domain-containing protein [Caldilineaceae bacterium]